MGKLRNALVNRNLELSNWYRVRFDEHFIYREVSPPGERPWDDQFAWGKVSRICFLTKGLYESDELYFFTSEREESYLIPTEASGAHELLDEAVRRKLFDSETLIEAVTSEDRLYCWPPIGNGKDSSTGEH